MTYRVGNHQPQNVYRDDAYIGVMFTAEDAALVVEALNEIDELRAVVAKAEEEQCGCLGGPLAIEWAAPPGDLAEDVSSERLKPPTPTGGEWDNAKPYRIYSRWVQAQDRSARSVYAAILEAYAVGLASEPSGTKPEAADSCTGCTAAKGDPSCPVHHGRKPRGPKPPPLGPGCICDGSGRTCPRHGAVI